MSAFERELTARILRENDPFASPAERVLANRTKWLDASGGFACGPQTHQSAAWAKLRLGWVIHQDRLNEKNRPLLDILRRLMRLLRSPVLRPLNTDPTR